MDNFIVSARKYRPQNFATVVGQSHITTTLKNAIIHKQLAHAFLFTGPRGVGKTTCARILAKTINCENQTPEGEACNTCHSCVSFDQGTSMNIHELDAASNNSVDDIRALVEQVRFAPQAGQYKVYIIDEVHMLSSAAFNAFLKTLEEPPHYAIFILATTEKHKILPTILSRCQIFDFKRITLQDTSDHLQEICDKESIQAEKAALHVIAQKSEGCMRDALSILDKIVSFTGGNLSYAQTLEHLNILDEDYYFRLIGFMLESNLPDALLLFDEINRKGFEADILLEGFSEFLRNILVSQDPRAAGLLEVSEDFRERYHRQAAATSTDWLIAALNLVNEGTIHYKTARNKRLHTELLLIKLAYLGQAIELTATDKGISKKKLTDNARTLQFRALQPLVVATTGKDARAGMVQEPQPEARLMIEKEAVAPKPRPEAPPVMDTSQMVPDILMKTRTGSLKKIHEQLAQKKQLIVEARPLEQKSLEEAWKLMLNHLSSQKTPVAVINNLTQARLRWDENMEPNQFIVITDSPIHRAFVQSNRIPVLDFLQNHFLNKALVFQIEVDFTPPAPENNLPRKTAREQFEEMAAIYPQVRELKERLKLEIDR